MKCLKAMVLDLAKSFWFGVSAFQYTAISPLRGKNLDLAQGEWTWKDMVFLVRSRRRKGKKGSARPFIRMKALLQLWFHAAVGVVECGTRWAYKGESRKEELMIKADSRVMFGRREWYCQLWGERHIWTHAKCTRTWIRHRLPCMKSITISIESGQCIVRTETNSNDFGRFWNYLTDSNSNLVVLEKFSSKHFEVGVCSGVHSHTMGLYIVKHVLWHVYTYVLMCRDRCRHTVQRKERYRKREHHHVGTTTHIQTNSKTDRHNQHTQNRHNTLPFQLWLCS